MYYYIVDPQKLSQKEFERVQNVLYSSLSEFRISGEVMRVTGLRTIQQLTENAFAHEAKTIVAVGGDETLHEVVNAVGLREMTVGYIPLEETPLSNTLGLKDILQSVKTIASRRIEEMDLGIINGNYFLSKLTFENETAVEINFSVDLDFKGTIKATGFEIVNCQIETAGEKKNADPTDGYLDVMFLQKPSSWQSFMQKRKILRSLVGPTPTDSILHVKKIQINSPVGLPIKLSGKTVAKTPALVEVIPKALKFIVGKDRVF